MLTPDDLRAAGCFRLNGVWSHRLGDHRARRILDGTLPLDEALAAERAHQRQAAAAQLPGTHADLAAFWLRRRGGG